jgi:hypothetical protein
VNAFGLDTEALVAGERFARELQQNAFENGRHVVSIKQKTLGGGR